jgi:hypothetical protein
MSKPELETYNGAEFQIALPTHWERYTDGPGPPVALIAMEPDNGGERFRANVVLTIEDLDDGERWQQTVEESLAEHLQDYVLLDEQHVESGVRRLFHHFSPDTGAITAEQWAWPVGDRGFSLTASAGTFDYDGKADLFASIAARFRSQRRSS